MPGLAYIKIYSAIENFKNWGHSQPLFLYYSLSIDSKYNLPMAGFELWISGVESDRSTNCATTTALQ